MVIEESEQGENPLQEGLVYQILYSSVEQRPVLGQRHAEPASPQIQSLRWAQRLCLAERPIRSVRNVSLRSSAGQPGCSLFIAGGVNPVSTLTGFDHRTGWLDQAVSKAQCQQQVGCHADPAQGAYPGGKLLDQGEDEADQVSDEQADNNRPKGLRPRVIPGKTQDQAQHEENRAQLALHVDAARIQGDSI